MSPITKEFTKEQLQQIIETDHVQCGEASALARIALASLEAEAVAFRSKLKPPSAIGSESWDYTDHRQPDAFELENCVIERLFTAPPAPVSVHEAAPVAYIFKHPAGRLFWSLTDESNKGQSDVMPVYSAPVSAFVPPAIEPDYEVIKGILPTANPDEYACCIAADMWNACRDAMLQGADGNSPVIAKAYDIEAFGVFSATEGENGLMLQIERFRFGTGKCPQIGKENMVPKFALQAIINRLQEHCDSMGNDALVDILSTPAAPQQEVKSGR